MPRRHPELTVDPEPIYVRDGDVWTSAGITAGMHLTLAIVEADHGHALALAVARELVMFLRRPGGRKQFSTVLSAQTDLSVRLTDLVAWMAENLHRPLSVDDLAARAALEDAPQLDLVPGGYGQEALTEDEVVLSWLHR